MILFPMHQEQNDYKPQTSWPNSYMPYQKGCEANKNVL